MARKIRLLEVAGTHYEMGYIHGSAYRDDIRAYTADRVHLSGDKNWTGQSLSHSEIIALGEACLTEHEAYAPELVDELRGMSAATGLSLPELIIMNGFTDFIDVVYNVGQRIQENTWALDDCTAAIVPPAATSGYGYYVQTWDMHDTATPYVILLRGRPQDEPHFLVFTTTGCVGQIGMNSAGIAVGINNLLGGDGQVGVTWPFVVRKVLQQTTLDDALACITSAKLAGAHNFLLCDKSGRGYNIEAMSSRYSVEEVVHTPYVHTNHCLVPSNHAVERKRTPESQASSEARLARANALLSEQPITLSALIDLTRDETAICVRAQPPLHVETCGAAIMCPATGEFWAVWGLPTESDYERFVV